MRCAAVRILGVALVTFGVLSAPTTGVGEDRLPSTDRIWRQLLSEAHALGLPTKFLRAVPPSFVQFEFDDLHSYAAEYHLGEHRMVLNRALSFNGAGATLRPLGRLPHAQIETLYHELFHAYIDYLVTAAEASPEVASDSVLAFARVQQGCHYGAVLITPVVQKKGETEERFLTERESWEALNETWAVFVGWIVWNQLELTSSAARSIQKSGKSQDEWVNRLRSADREGILREYYERLTEQEVAVLMKNVIEFSPSLLARAKEVLSGFGQGVERYGQCG